MSAERRYADAVLSWGETMTALLRDRVDFDRGRFEPTADFRVVAEDRWEVTPLGYDQNRTDEVDETGKRVFDPLQAVVESFLPLLAGRDRLLIVEGYVASRTRDKEPDPSSPQRLLAHPRQDEFEEYLVVTGPQQDAQVVRSTVSWAPIHRGIGAVVEADVSRVPPDMSLIDEAFLSRIFQNVLALFMRQTSFEAYLLWWRDGAGEG